MTILLHTLFFLIVYSYIVYPILLFVLSIHKKKNRVDINNNDDLPSITLLVPAYNEAAFVEQKVKNSLELNYQKNKLEYVWVTDGSSDETPMLLKKFSEIRVLHQDERRGKMHAMNRAVKLIDSEIIVFNDANTFLTPDTLLYIASHFKNKNTGCVAGEKQIISENKSAAGSGEGLYWKYESWIKQLDFRFNTTLGAAGELFAIRKELFQEVEEDTILDDFLISIRIALKGYKVAYEPNAIAREYPSENVFEEMKRKIRIAAGGFQSMTRVPEIFNFFKHPKLFFQFVSHKVFRWLICPIALILLIPVNLILLVNFQTDINLYIFTVLHALFYLMVITGWLLEKNIKQKGWIFLPYYFANTNLSQIKGLVRYLRKTQTVNWERAKRATK